MKKDIIDDESTLSGVNQVLRAGEVILWQEEPIKKGYVLGKMRLLPYAAVWLFFDIFALIVLIAGGMAFSSFGMFLIFSIFHLIPVWVCLFQFLKALSEVNGIEYYITNQRIFKLVGKENKKRIKETIFIKDLESVMLKNGIINKLFGTNDLVFKSNKESNKLINFEKNCETIFYGLEDVEELMEKITYLIANKNKENNVNKFSIDEVVCEHCQTKYDKELICCPNCGFMKQDE